VNEVSDFDTGGATYNVSLPSFEGPLDLLLHLCQKHELNILDIPIAFVTEKYLEYLKIITLADLDVAAEYLVMAATLAHIKSKMLLPQIPEGQEEESTEDEEDPREALIRRLLEYQKYKKAGEDLAAKGIRGADYFSRGAPMEEAVPVGLPPLAEVSLFALMDAFQRVLSRSKIKITHDIIADRLSINDRIHELVEVFRTKKRLLFEELFEGATTRFDLVITFLALLEMTKLRMTRLYQSGPLTELYVEVGEAELRGLEAGDELTSAGPAATTMAEPVLDPVPETGMSGADEHEVDAGVETEHDGVSADNPVTNEPHAGEELQSAPRNESESESESESEHALDLEHDPEPEPIAKEDERDSTEESPV
jgi:segregation and condensation protein A